MEINLENSEMNKNRCENPALVCKVLTSLLGVETLGLSDSAIATVAFEMDLSPAGIGSQA